MRTFRCFKLGWGLSCLCSRAGTNFLFLLLLLLLLSSSPPAPPPPPPPFLGQDWWGVGQGPSMADRTEPPVSMTNQMIQLAHCTQSPNFIPIPNGCTSVGSSRLSTYRLENYALGSSR